MTKRAAKPKPAESDLSYEEALAELERIVDRIESGEVGLEAALDEYERGMKLVQRCRAVLDRAEARVKRLEEIQAESAGGSSAGGESADDAIDA